MHRMMQHLLSPLLACPLCPMTELENTLSSVDADAFPAVQRYTVVETELVFLVALVCVLARVNLCIQPCRYARTFGQNIGQHRVTASG